MPRRPLISAAGGLTRETAALTNRSLRRSRLFVLRRSLLAPDYRYAPNGLRADLIPSVLIFRFSAVRKRNYVRAIENA